MRDEQTPGDAVVGGPHLCHPRITELFGELGAVDDVGEQQGAELGHRPEVTTAVPGGALQRRYGTLGRGCPVGGGGRAGNEAARGTRLTGSVPR